MSSIVTTETDEVLNENPATFRLFVAWQREDTREYIPVGRLTYHGGAVEPAYEFVYLAGAQSQSNFPGLGGLPLGDVVYTSKNLFPFFENRVMSRGRSDRGAFLRSLDLPETAEPTEVLARTEGRRATDTFELFPEPTLRSDGVAETCFFVRGVRHIAGAHEAIDRLSVGDRLKVRPEPENERDPNAVLVLGEQEVGYLPRYLTELVHFSYDTAPERIVVEVRHVGERSGPAHFRLLCSLAAPWPSDKPVFSDAAFVPLANSVSR